ncbi:DUF5405 family protein [Clostridium sp. Cult2]|uniref:DUF5405 family protein n=1 Tax=Clostridium sp. Cult2 TaxID=2079003 RepID=UPI001F481EE3|nr:DUF5405 family protein [Clostridium sp. Cult2]MCF6466376.1 hypothetical protein [Clostridium sp. Cult2]
MKIQIDNKYQITSDSMQYILQEKKKGKDKDGEIKEYKVNVGYYGKIYNALQGYKELQIRNSNVETIDELMQLIRSLDKKIERLLGGN